MKLSGPGNGSRRGGRGGERERERGRVREKSKAQCGAKSEGWRRRSLAGEGESGGGGSPVRGYIHGDSARCAVTGRLDVERLAASRTIFIVASDTLLVARFWKPEVPASTYSHPVAQSASRFSDLPTPVSPLNPSREGEGESERVRERKRQRRRSGRECREILQRPMVIIRADSARANGDVEEWLGFAKAATLPQRLQLLGKWTLLFPYYGCRRALFRSTKGNRERGRQRETDAVRISRSSRTE